MMRLARREKGFTLIEMMIVILVIAILATIVGLAVRNAGRRAKANSRLTLVKELMNAAVLYENDCGEPPGDLAEVAGAPGGDCPTGVGLYQGPYTTPHNSGDCLPLPCDPCDGTTAFTLDPATGLVTPDQPDCG